MCESLTFLFFDATQHQVSNGCYNKRAIPNLFLWMSWKRHSHCLRAKINTRNNKEDLR